MPEPRRRDPLHGVTLARLLARLVDHYGWDELGRRIRINCFTSDPSIASSLKFLRRTPWARRQLEALYLATDWPAEDVWPDAPAGRQLD